MGQQLSYYSIPAQAGRKSKMDYISIGSDSRKICSSVPPVFRFLAVVRAREWENPSGVSHAGCATASD
jgi:hypothetical protein